MEEDGLWRLFFLSGLPEAWMALRGFQNAREEESLTDIPAFSQPNPKKTEC